MIALVGYGYWGRNLARNFAPYLSWVVDADQSRLEQVRSLYPSTQVTTDLDQALRSGTVKAVLIATKADIHRDLAKQCLEQGCDVWIEKPVCRNFAEIDDLMRTAERHERLILVDHTFCYNPAVQKMREIDIGRPIYYDSTRISLGQFQPDVDVLLDLAIHDVSIIDYLYPDLELVDRDIVRNFHCNDKANQVIANLKFASGFTATINCNWISPVKKRQIILTGDQRSIVYDDMDLDKIKIYDTGVIDQDFNANRLGDTLAPRIATTEALAQARDHFLHCIHTRQQPLTNIYRARKIMEWIL